MSPLPTRKPRPFIPPGDLGEYLKDHPHLKVKASIGPIDVTVCGDVKPKTLRAIAEMAGAVAKEYPKGYVPSEDEEQEAFVQWLTARKIHFFAVPNGSYKSKRAAARFKRTGLQAGVPDLMICEPRGGFHGLFIEMKRTVKWKVSEDQKTWLALLVGKGYACAVALGASQAMEKTEQYLKLPKGTK